MVTKLPNQMSVFPDGGMSGKTPPGRFQFGSGPAGAKFMFLIDTATGQTWNMRNDGNNYFWLPMFFRDYGQEFDDTLSMLMSNINAEQSQADLTDKITKITDTFREIRGMTGKSNGNANGKAAHA